MANDLATIDGGAGEVKASTVDAFPGQEKKIILVHFVAACTDRYNPFGFTENAKRSNVVTTRSKEFQFLLGNFTFWQAKRAEKQYWDDDHKALQMMDWVQSHGQPVQWSNVDNSVRHVAMDAR